MEATTRNTNTIADAIKPHVDTYLLCRVYAETVAEEFDGIHRRILGNMGHAHTDPKHTYRMTEPELQRYYAACDQAAKDAGYIIPKGHCPALIADHERTKAEWALIEAAEEFMPGVTNNKLLCGTGKADGLETRQKYIELLVGLVVTRPGYRSPMKQLMPTT